jgi:chromosome segregation ATPase
MSNEYKKIGLLSSVKNENYINILKNENIELDNKLKKVNELVSKLKSQITQNEQEKNKLITTSFQKDKDLEIIKKQLEQTKSQVDELKNQNKIPSLVEENNILQKNKEANNNTIAELQQKITDLEFKLKSSSSGADKKKFFQLSGTHNYSLVIQGHHKKTTSEELPELIATKNNDGLINSNDFFLTGRNDILEIKEKNIKLKEQLEVLQKELNKHENDKINMMKELEQYNKEKNNLLGTLNEKNEEINGKLNKENELNNNLMKQLIENKKIKNNLDNIKIKCQNLEKNKKELEDVIFQQENKVNELSSSVKRIINIVKKKNLEINNNKIYIKNLKKTIKN